MTVVHATSDTAAALARQANSCDHIGSPLYGSLLRGLLSDFRSGGLTFDLLDGVSEQPVHDAIPLRYLAAGHRLALSGSAPDLARHYPSCGGNWSGQDVTRDFLHAVRAHPPTVEAALSQQVQTNEIGRAVVLTCALSHVMALTGLPLRTLELGASAGLLSRLPWFRVDIGTGTCGPPDAAVTFGPEWCERPPATIVGALQIVDQAACDVSPIDPTTDDGRLRIQSFVWPDQLERIGRLRAALQVAAAHPLQVDAADAGEWLQCRLEGPLPTQTATVVFHSIVWQYLPGSTRDAVRGALARAGTSATVDSPLAWVRMEPAAPTHADVRMTMWPGGHETVLAEVGYHGHGVRWQL